MSFEWQTDEEYSWDEEPILPEPPQPRRRWRFLLVLLLGLLGVWWVVRWQIGQQLAEATSTIEEDILATHNFLLQTAVSQDESLFTANLSGRNPDWTALQKTLLNDGLLLARPMFGWQHESDSERLTVDDVTLQVEPDLQGAVLLYPQTHAVQTTAAGLTETVRLQHTAVYRQGTRRWLYAPPLTDFWGDWAVWEGERLSLAHTEREAELVEQLGADLDLLLQKMCRDLGDLNCSEEMRVNLRMSTDPDVWLAINDIETMLTTGLRIELPTPTLVGLPTDEASYQVLYRAYGVQVATAVLAHQIEYDCCRHELFFRALRDYQLAQLDLQPWPLTATMYQQMLDWGFNSSMVRHWTRRWEEAPPQFLQVWMVEDPDPIWQQVYMLVEFLAAEETAVSPTEMMRLMDRNSYNGWLADVLQGEANVSTLESRLLQHVYSQTNAGQQAEPPIPLPDGKITLVCQGYASSNGGHVYTYDLARKTWTEPFADLFDPNSIHTADGELFVMTEIAFAELETTFKFWLAGEDEFVLIEEAQIAAGNQHWINYFVADEKSEYLLRYEHLEGETNLALLPTACAGGSCPAVALDGWTVFAPNNEHLLIQGLPSEPNDFDPDTPFRLQYLLHVMTPDGELRQFLHQGGAPFWLNDAVYGYVQIVEGGWELVTAVTDQNQPRYILSQTEMLAEFPVAERPGNLFLTQVVVNPYNPQELLLQLSLPENPSEFEPNIPSYLFKLTLTPDFTGIESIHLLREETFSGTIDFSANGRHIIHGHFNQYSVSVTWHFYNEETGETELSFDSPYLLAGTDDGQWYVQLTEDYVLLRAPLYDYQEFIPHGFGECHQALLSVEE
ncbi:hypothetical protein [Candidatus Leptofilum sp.]|uniref:hypothetical protein n=1 Tax=Candidatus Leptofilum sp. TaxID=3241576 RepID=UPI003B5CA619